jgi:hypothetical protein
MQNKCAYKAKDCTGKLKLFVMEDGGLRENARQELAGDLKLNCRYSKLK